MLRRNFTGFLCSLPFFNIAKGKDLTQTKPELGLLRYDFSKDNNSIIRVFSQINKQGVIDFWFIGDKSGMISYNFSISLKNGKFSKDSCSNFHSINIGKMIKKKNPNTKVLVRLIKNSTTKIQDDFIEV